MAIGYPPLSNPEKEEDFERYHRICDDLPKYEYSIKKKDVPLDHRLLDNIGQMRKDTIFIRGDFKRANAGTLPSDFEDAEKKAEVVDDLIDRCLEERAEELVSEYKQYLSIASEESQRNTNVIKQYYERMRRLGLRYKKKILETKKNYKKLKITAATFLLAASHLLAAYLAKPDWVETQLNNCYHYVCNVLETVPKWKYKKDIEDAKESATEELSERRKEALEKLNEGLEALNSALE